MEHSYLGLDGYSIDEISELDSIGILILSFDEKIVFVNEYLSRLIGYSTNEIKENFFKIFSNEKIDIFSSYSSLKNSISNNKKLTFEYEIRKKDNSSIGLQISLKVLENNKGIIFSFKELRGCINLIKNNMILKERIRLALLGYKAGMYEWNMVDDSAYYSPEWIAMLDLDDSDIFPHLNAWKMRVHPDDLENIMESVSYHVKNRKKRIEAIHRLKNKKLGWRWILGRGFISYDTNGNAVKMVGIHTDITEQKSYELELKYKAQVIEQVKEGVITIDLNGNIKGWNNGAKLIFGYKIEEVLYKHISILFESWSHISFEQYIKKIISGDIVEDRLELIGKYGNKVSVDFKFSLFKDDELNIISIIVYCNDVI